MLILTFIATLFVTISIAAAIVLAGEPEQRQPVRNPRRR